MSAAKLGEALGTVHERVLAVLADMPSIGKDAKNVQQGFNYRSHDVVLDELNPRLAKFGVFIVPNVIERIPGVRTTSKGYSMYEVNLHVQYTFYGTSGDSFSASAWGEGTDSGDKATNKAMTMAFKNVIAQVFALATGDPDPDGSSDEPTSAGAAAPGGQAGKPGDEPTGPAPTQFRAPSVKAPTKAAVKALTDACAELIEQHGVDPIALQNAAGSALPWPDFIPGMDPATFKEFAGKVERRLTTAREAAA